MEDKKNTTPLERKPILRLVIDELFCKKTGKFLYYQERMVEVNKNDKGETKVV